MLKRIGSLALAGVVVVGAGTLVATRGLGAAAGVSPDLTVHEWGTFTSVAGPNGQAVDWQPLSGPQDLPCFVSQLNQNSFKVISTNGWLPGVTAKVRMETPVLYFYSPREVTVDVKVRFPQGLITEWYPQATVPMAKMPIIFNDVTGEIAWKGVKVLPGGTADFPTESGKSHYYAARETDAAPLQVGTQREKFLFYRGLAGFAVPVSGTVADDGRIVVTNTGRHDIGSVVLLENDGHKLGYRISRGLRGEVTLDRPVLNSNFESLRQDLETLLTEQGLYAREAKAMVETWRDSWFEEGTRVFYILPQASVDALLPLDVSPKPDHVSRVFVGRLEIITPEMEDDVERAILRNDLDALNRYGRFLGPIAQGLMVRPSIANHQTEVQAQLRAVAASHAPANSCK